VLNVSPGTKKRSIVLENYIKSIKQKQNKKNHPQEINENLFFVLYYFLIVVDHVPIFHATKVSRENRKSIQFGRKSVTALFVGNFFFLFL
jgi:hypothetical protein